MSDNCSSTYNILSALREKKIDYYVKETTSGKPSRFASFATGVIKIAEGIDWDKHGAGTLTKDMFESADKLIDNIAHTGTLQKFLEVATESDIESAMQKLHGYSQIYSASIMDPISVIHNKDISDVARGSLEYFVDYNDKATRNKLEMTWKPWRMAYNIFFAPNVIFKNPVTGKTVFQYMTNLAAAYRMHDASNNDLITKESIANSTSQITDQASNIFHQTIRSSATENVNEKMIDGLISYKDPSITAPHLLNGVATKQDIDTAIRAKIEDVIRVRFPDEYNLHDDKQKFFGEVHKALDIAQGKINKFWYGVSNPFITEADGTVRPIKPSEIIKLSNTTDLGSGKTGDSFLKNYIVNGSKLYSMLKDLENPSKLVSDYIKKWEDIDKVNIRMNYMPTPVTKEAEAEDVMEFFKDAGREFNVEFSHSKARTIKEAPASDSDMSFLINAADYMKEYRFTSHLKAAYALARKVNQNMVNDEVLRHTNPEAFAMLLARSEKDIRRFENPKGKNLSPFVEAFKNANYSLSGLAIAMRITGSPVTNLAAAAMNSMIKMDVTTQYKRKQEFNIALKGDSAISEMAHFIDNDSDNYFVMSKMTTVLTKEAVENQKTMQRKALEITPSIIANAPTALLNVMTKWGNTTSDRLMNSFYGITPRSWEMMSMAGTENILMKQASAEAFFDTKRVGLMYAKTHDIDIDNMTDTQKAEVMSVMKKNYKNNTAYYYNTIKQMYGAYTEDVKANYAGDYMKDASNLLSITLGQQLIMHSAFKQISINNADMTARIFAYKASRFNKETAKERPVNLSGIGGVMLIGLYNHVRDMAIKEKYGRIIPSIGVISNADIFEDANRKYKMIAYAVKSGMNMPTTQKELIDASRYWKFLLGVGAGGDATRYSSSVTSSNEYKSAVKDYEGMMDIVKEYTTSNFYPMKNLINFLPLYVQTKGIIDGMNAKDVTPKQRRVIMDQAFAKGQFYADGGNKILKLTRDLAIVLVEGKETYYEGGDYNDALKFRDYVLGSLNRISQLNVYLPPVPFAPDYNGSMYNKLNNLTRLEYLTNKYNDYGNKKRGAYYKDNHYEADKAFRHAMGSIKAPSWELRRVKSQIDYGVK